MPEKSVRWPCPVCLGVRMQKRSVGKDGGVILDSCDRCGGVWFEKGEVQALRALRPVDLLPHIAPRSEVHHMRCRHCEGVVSRDEIACPACSEPARLDCPSCDRQLETTEYHDVRLDYCRHCHGVWFDQHEIHAIWRLSLIEVGQTRIAAHQADGGAGSSAAASVVDVLMYAPDVVVHGSVEIYQIAASTGDAPELAASAAEAAGGVVEVAGEVASKAFEFIVEAIAAILSG